MTLVHVVTYTTLDKIEMHQMNVMQRKIYVAETRVSVYLYLPYTLMMGGIPHYIDDVMGSEYIRHDVTSAYTSNKSSTAERYNSTITNIARPILTTKKISQGTVYSSRTSIRYDVTDKLSVLIMMMMMVAVILPLLLAKYPGSIMTCDEEIQILDK